MHALGEDLARPAAHLGREQLDADRSVPAAGAQRAREAGQDIIRDADGANIAVLNGFDGATLQGVMVGSDLVVVAHNAPIFRVENFLGHEDSFLGIRNGDEFIASNDLFA